MGFLKIVKSIHTSRGLTGFYAGFKLNLIRMIPNTAIMFTSYEYLSKKIENVCLDRGLI